MLEPAGLANAVAGRYSIDRELGAGGMAVVYLARDLKHDRPVALKVLRPEIAAQLGAQRFLREIRLTAQLDHPHILTLIDSGEGGGFLWCVFPYVRGESLRERLRRDRHLPIAEALDITKQIAAALDYAHRQGVVHRDIKPENILVFEGQAILADFGIAMALSEAGAARLTQTGVSVGTPQYMSPEQATGDKNLDARSDVYSLGAVVYEMLAGQVPHQGATSQAVIASLITQAPVRLRALRDTVPDAVDAAVHRALAKLPVDRFDSASQFADALTASRVQADGGSRRKSRAAWLGAGILTALLAALTLSKLSVDRAVDPPAQLTFSGNVSRAAVSPDGARLALVTRECVGTTCRAALSWQERGGPASLRLLERQSIISVAWSQDGKHLLFFGADTAGRRAAFLISALGGQPQSLRAQFASFFAGGDSLLLVDSDPERPSLKARSTTGTATVDLGTMPTDLMFPALSPDGRWIATWSSTDEGMSVVMLDRQLRRVDSLRGNYLYRVRWHPEGNALFVARADSLDLMLQSIERIAVDPRTGRFARTETLVTGPLGGLIDFDVTGDGRTLMYVAGPREYIIHAASRTATGELQTPRVLRRSTGFAVSTMSPDGRHVAVLESASSGQGSLRIAILPFEGGKEQWISPPLRGGVAGFPGVDWTPDSRTLLYVEEGDTARVVSVDVTTAERGVKGVSPYPPGRAVRLTALSADRVLWSGEGSRDVILQDFRNKWTRRVILSDSTQLVYDVVRSSNDSTAVAVVGTNRADSFAIGLLSLMSGRFLKRGDISIDFGMGQLTTGELQVALRSRAGSMALFRFPSSGRAERPIPLPIASALFYDFSADGRRATIGTSDFKRDVWIVAVP